MAFKKGDRGNPKGRPKGIVDKRVKYAQLLNSHAEELIEIAVKKAKDGDAMMMKMVLGRVLPGKPRDNFVSNDIMQGTLEEQSTNITKALNDNKLTPLEAKDLMTILKTKQEIVEFSDIKRQIEELKGMIGDRA